jgi:hypothetical protein
MSQWLALVYIKVVTGDGVDDAQDGVDDAWINLISRMNLIILIKKILVKGIMCFWLKNIFCLKTCMKLSGVLLRFVL